MNGKVQGIIVCGVIAASLAGVMAFLNATGDNTDKDSSSSQTEEIKTAEESVESVIILESETDDIKSVHVANENGEFTIDKPASGKSTWTVEELGSLNQNTTLKENLINTCSVLEAYKLVEENASDMAKYGLEEPAGSFEITYGDDSVQTVYIGDEAPESRYRYVKVGDSSDVYMVLGSKLAYFLDSAYDYADLSLIATPSEDEWPDYGVETVNRSDWDHEVTFENDPEDIEGMLSSQVISSPIFAYLNITGSSDVTHGMWGLIASACNKVKPTDEDLAEYGLDEPICTVNLKGDGYDYTLKVGGQSFDPTVAEGDTPVLLGYYCTIEGVSGTDAVYTIVESNLPWVTFKIEDVITNIMLPNYLVDISEIEIDVEGEKTVYEINSNGTSSDSFEDGSTADVTSVVCDGQELDVYNFKSLYQYIMTCPTTELCFDDPESDCLITITETLANGGETKVELFKDTARRYIVKLNGVTSYRIQSTWVDTLLKNMDNIKNGKAIDDNY